MSSVPNPIAGSLTQAAIQQSQVARQRDSVRNRDERNADRMRELLEKKLNSIEDSDLTSDDRMTVREDESNAQHPGGRAPQEEEHHDEAPTPPTEAPPDDLTEPGHIDVRA